MNITDGSTSVAVTDLLWTDEHEWQPVSQSVSRTLTGALVIQSAAQLAGRPITLASGDDYGWVSGAHLAQLQAWAATPGQELTLTLRGVARDVVFRHHEKPAITSTPLVDFSDPAPTDKHVVTLKFMEI